jgi:hypothetical protein
MQTRSHRGAPPQPLATGSRGRCRTAPLPHDDPKALAGLCEPSGLCRLRPASSAKHVCQFRGLGVVCERTPCRLRGPTVGYRAPQCLNLSPWYDTYLDIGRPLRSILRRTTVSCCRLLHSLLCLRRHANLLRLHALSPKLTCLIR